MELASSAENLRTQVAPGNCPLHHACLLLSLKGACKGSLECVPWQASPLPVLRSCRRPYIPFYSTWNLFCNLLYSACVSVGFTDSNLAGDNTNHCLKATHICSMNKKCVRWRTAYASICTRGAEAGETCNRLMCHKGLRHFFEKVHEDFTKRLLFCPCENEVCGERRRKAIVPECSFQESIKPNCLSLWHACVQDNICK